MYNIEKLSGIISRKPNIAEQKASPKQLISEYVAAQTSVNVHQNIITNLIATQDGYLAEFKSKPAKKLNVVQVSDVISRNQLDGERTLFIGELDPKNYKQGKKIGDQVFTQNLHMSEGIDMEVFDDQKLVIFKQREMDSWVAIKGGDLTDWKMMFNGVTHGNPNLKLGQQRFNQYGLTGCLNFYNTIFKIFFIFNN